MQYFNTLTMPNTLFILPFLLIAAVGARNTSTIDSSSQELPTFFSTASRHILYVGDPARNTSTSHDHLDPWMIQTRLTERTIYERHPWNHPDHMAGGEKLDKGWRDDVNASAANESATGFWNFVDRNKSNAIPHAFFSFRFSPRPTSHQSVKNSKSADVAELLNWDISSCGDMAVSALVSAFHHGWLMLGSALVATLTLLFFCFLRNNIRKKKHRQNLTKVQTRKNTHACRTVEWWLPSIGLSTWTSAVKVEPPQSRKKKHLRNQKKKKEKKKSRDPQRPRRRSKRSSLLEWCWSWSVTLLFLLLFVTGEFIAIVNAFDPLPNGHSSCSALALRKSTDLCGIVDIWIAGTYGTPSTTQTAAKNATVSQYGEIDVWDVSQVTNMDSLFYEKLTFNGDVSKWNVENVLSMIKSKFFICIILIYHVKI